MQLDTLASRKDQHPIFALVIFCTVEERLILCVFMSEEFGGQVGDVKRRAGVEGAVCLQ